MRNSKLLIGLTCLIAGLFILGKGQEVPIEQALGISYTASDHDCSMLLNLVDVTGTCYYTFLSSSEVISVAKRYADMFSIPLGTEAKLYDAKAITVGGVVIVTRKSDEVDMYVILIGGSK